MDGVSYKLQKQTKKKQSEDQTACLSFTLINSAFIQSALQIINTYDVVGEGHINLVNMACSPFTAFVPIEALVFDL